MEPSSSSGGGVNFRRLFTCGVSSAAAAQVVRDGIPPSLAFRYTRAPPLGRRGGLGGDLRGRRRESIDLVWIDSKVLGRRVVGQGWIILVLDKEGIIVIFFLAARRCAPVRGGAFPYRAAHRRQLSLAAHRHPCFFRRCAGPAQQNSAQ
jgi:hypothetical protein